MEEEIVKELLDAMPNGEEAQFLTNTAREIASFIPEGYQEKSFILKWKKERPTSIKIEGEEKKIKYFKDGIILFTDNDSATYEWIEDRENEMKVKIFYRIKKKGG